MALKKQPSRSKRPVGASFRFTEEAAYKLKILSDALNLTQVEALEALIGKEFDQARKKYPEDFKRAEKNAKKDESDK